MSDYVCPFCGTEIDNPDWFECGDEYTEQCPSCEREFNVTIEYEPIFTTHTPRDLQHCKSICAFWVSHPKHCDFESNNEPRTTQYTMRYFHLPSTPPITCPLGYGGMRQV